MEDDREPRQIAGILKQPEESEERDDHRQNDGDGVGNGHRHHAVRSDEQIVNRLRDSAGDTKNLVVSILGAVDPA